MGLNKEMKRGPEQAKTLTKVLGQSEHVKELVKESAEELSEVNSTIKQELANPDPRPGVENALEKSEAVEIKVHEASEKLTVVNQALESEVRDRHMVDNQLAEALQREEATLHASLHDVLTDLPNRALFNDRLEHGFAQSKRHGWILALMFLDLDNFKTINDTYGHEVGDIVLQKTAERLGEDIRGDDTVSRYGGDEFLYLLTGIKNEKHIATIAEKIIKKLQEPCNIITNGLNTNLSVNVSIGISIYPKDGTTADWLIKSADQAMYRAKQNKSGYAFSAFSSKGGGR